MIQKILVIEKFYRFITFICVDPPVRHLCSRWYRMCMSSSPFLRGLRLFMLFKKVQLGSEPLNYKLQVK